MDLAEVGVCRRRSEPQMVRYLQKASRGKSVDLRKVCNKDWEMAVQNQTSNQKSTIQVGALKRAREKRAVDRPLP